MQDDAARASTTLRLFVFRVAECARNHEMILTTEHYVNRIQVGAGLLCRLCRPTVALHGRGRCETDRVTGRQVDRGCVCACVPASVFGTPAVTAGLLGVAQASESYPALKLVGKDIKSISANLNICHLEHLRQVCSLRVCGRRLLPLSLSLCVCVLGWQMRACAWGCGVGWRERGGEGGGNRRRCP